LHKSYTVGRTPLHVLKGIDLDVAPGELVSVMGASGSGKSTLMNLIGLLDRLDEGEYHLDGTDMSGLSETQAAHYRSRWIGFVFQSFHLIPFKNAAQNVALPLYYQGVSRRERQRLAEDYLAKVGLSERAEHLPAELSGGEQQRVAIARALVSKPKVLLADEPTGALDSATSYEVMKVLQGVQGEGVTVLVITHERDVAQMTDRVVQLVDGQVAGDHPQPRRDPEWAAAGAPAASAVLAASPSPAASLP
ncbi:MAG: ABC transporter ATP-binding protein, partial [Thermoanaerobaculia bacterium]